MKKKTTKAEQLSLIPQKGVIIAFEGLDHSFKETNAKKVYAALKKLGVNVVFATSPNYKCPTSVFIRNFLKGVYPKDIDMTIAGQFYLLHFYHMWKTKLEKKYNEGAVIIMDRGIFSSILYQGYDKVKAEIELLGLPTVDLNICMTMPFSSTVKLLEAKKDKDELEKNIPFLNATKKELERIIRAKEHNTVRVTCGIGCTISKEETIYKKCMDVIHAKKFPQIEEKVKGGK